MTKRTNGLLARTTRQSWPGIVVLSLFVGGNDLARADGELPAAAVLSHDWSGNVPTPLAGQHTVTALFSV